MKRHSLHLPIFCLAFLFTLALTLPGTAATLLYDDFQSYASGAKPTNPGDGNTNDWYFNSTFTSITVPGSSPGGHLPNTQVLHVSKSNTGSFSSFGRRFEAQTKEDTEFLKVAFTIQFHSFTNSHYYIQLVNPSDTAAVSLRIQGANLAVTTRADGPGSGATLTYWHPQGGVLRLDNWYQFEMTVNLKNQTFRLEITNLTDPTQHGSTPEYFFSNNVTTLNGILFRSNGTTSGSADLALDWSLNDVQIQTIPEPAAMSLLIGTLLLLSARKRFRPRHSSNQASQAAGRD